MARAPRAASVVTTLPVADLAAARRGHRRSSGELVAEHIRRLIFEGALKQGDHLRQDEIAAELGRQPDPGARGGHRARPRGLADDRAASRRLRPRAR